MKSMSLRFVYALLLILVAVSCKKENDNDNTDDTIDAKTLKVNTFIKDAMPEVYLWTAHIPVSVLNNYRQESNPKAFFDKLLYKTKDKWSTITDDYDGLVSSLSGRETTYGYSLVFYRFQASSNLYAVIQYVYPRTPADEAGLKRGDILLQVNGSPMTMDNYLALIYSNEITITLGVLESNVISPGGTVSLTAVELALNPVVIAKTINHENTKIGYILYTQYIDDRTFMDDFDSAMINLKAEGITELILDLRYNPGGHVSAARHLCSALAPLSNVLAEDVLINKKWNTLYQNYWQNTNNTAQLVEKFDKSLANVNIGLERLYILTSGRTASASELTITGLRAYMPVTLIGETTVGKYVASATLRSEIQQGGQRVVDSEISNWAIQPIIYSYTNKNNETFENGFVPEHSIEDDVFDPTPLGDKNEALLAKALEVITGVAPTRAAKAPLTIPSHQLVGTAFSRFDKFRSNAIEQLER
jgi:C-terminal processing protease CtpA/Prc